MPSPTFTNDYAKDGKQLRRATREADGHRCIRCGHPYRSDDPANSPRGEWSACDERCTHKGPIRQLVDYLPSHNGGIWQELDGDDVIIPSGVMVGINKDQVQAKWRILTVHHFDGNKAHDVWWNHLSLCQRCHLAFQTRVNPEIPWLFEHSDWLKPYVAGFYAKKYENLNLSREQVMERLEELLAYERKA